VLVLDGGVVQGPPGASVSLGDAGTACPYGGVALWVDGGAHVFVCNGAPGAMGSVGPQGPVGPSVTLGDAGTACPYGGVALGGSQVVCNGAPGAAGMAGSAGAQGPSGPAGPAGTVYGEPGARFAGFTTAKVPGNHGGREAMHATCAAQYSGSHMCHFAEYVLTNSATTPPATGAWLDPSCGDVTDNLGHQTMQCNLWGEARPDMGRYISVDPNAYNDDSCTTWNSAVSGVSGLTITPAGGVAVACTTVLPIACCSTPFAEVFRGFTTATTQGNVNGRAVMHGLCGAQYPGSHLCHVAEYHRGHPTSVPAGGAWVDASTLGNYGFISNFSAVARAGRFTGRETTFNNDNCKQWTSNGTGINAYVVKPAGTTTAACTSSLPLACCGN
jgi:hypothetical protein